MEKPSAWKGLAERIRLNAEALWIQILTALRDDFRSQVRQGAIDPQKESDVEEWAWTVTEDLSLFVGPVLAHVTMLCSPLNTRLPAIESFFEAEVRLRPIDAITKLPKLILYSAAIQAAKEVSQANPGL